MFRITSCLSNGIVIGSKAGQCITSRACDAMTLHKSISSLTIISNGHKFATQELYRRNVSSINATGRRNLYTGDALGINKLDRMRSRKEQMFTGSAKERYIERLTGYVQNGDIQSIFKDDLVNLIGIASDEKDLDLLETIVANADKNQSDFFVGWGTSVMRLYYKMGQIDRALKNTKDTEKFGDFFNLRSCYKVLMSMLYDAQRYADVLDVFEFAQRHLRKESPSDTEDEFPSDDRDLNLLAFAAMAKTNNEQALRNAEALYMKLRQSNKNVGLRPTALVAYMAVSNNQPKLALNLISSVSNRTYISLRELKIVALLKLDRFEDILLQLREYMGSIKRDSNLLLQDTLDVLQANANKIEDSAMRRELEDILAEIKEGGHIASVSIEELIFRPIDRERQFIRFDQRMVVNGARQSGGYGNERYQGGNYNNDRYQGGNNNFGGGNRFQSRGPRNQFGNNRYNSRPFRRDNSDQDDSEFDAEDDQRRRLGRDGRQQGRFNYQSMNLD